MWRCLYPQRTCLLPVVLYFTFILLCSGRFWASTFGQWCVALAKFKVGTMKTKQPGNIAVSVSVVGSLSVRDVQRAAGLCVCLTEGEAELNTHIHTRTGRAEGQTADSMKCVLQLFSHIHT